MSELTRRDVLTKVAATTAAGAGLAIGGATAAEAKSTKDFKRHAFVVDLKRDIPSFDAVRAPEGDDPYPTGPYYVPGAIFPAGSFDVAGDLDPAAEAIGEYTSWGWIYNPTTGASARSANFSFSGSEDVAAGSIVVEGDRSPFSESGIATGTGAYRRALGTYTLETIDASKGAFRATFDVYVHRR
jgi:hypothetical protein